MVKVIIVIRRFDHDEDFMETRVTRADYDRWLRIARRRAFAGTDAEDLLQEALMVALSAGRGVADPAWLSGVMRNVASASHRRNVRRQRREAQYGEAAPNEAGEGVPEAFVSALPPGLRVVMQLGLSGHTRAEIRHLLRLSDEALRQRLMQLRRLASQAGLKLPAERSGSLAFGLIRQALRPMAHVADLGSHDPDGHLFLIGGSHKTKVGGHR